MTFFQIVLILSFIVFNVFFDYFTIIQTKLFIEASIKANSIFRSILFIFSDFVVTMNTFILAYAAFILLVIQYLMWPDVTSRFVREQNVKNDVEIVQQLPAILGDFDSEIFSQRPVFSNSFEGILVNGVNDDDYRSIYISYYSTIDPRETDLQLLIMSTISPLKVLPDEKFTSIPVEKAVQLATTLRNESLVNRLTRDDDTSNKVDLPLIEEASLTVNSRISSVVDLESAYTVAFFQTDALEDGFPVTIFGSLEVLPLVFYA